MLACPVVKGPVYPGRELRSCRQQQHLCAVVGSCAVLVKEAGPDDAKADRVVSSGRLYGCMPKHAGLPAVGAIPAAEDFQHTEDPGCAPVYSRSQRRKPSKAVRWSHLHSRLLGTLKQRPELLPQGSRVLVAVSGGQDSMALLRLLIDLQRVSSKRETAPWPLQLMVGHCDHNMRADSAQNEAFVRMQVRHMGSRLRVWQRTRHADGASKHSKPSSDSLAQEHADLHHHSKATSEPQPPSSSRHPHADVYDSILQQLGPESGDTRQLVEHLASDDRWTLPQQMLQEILQQQQQQAAPQAADVQQQSGGCHSSQIHAVAAMAVTPAGAHVPHQHIIPSGSKAQHQTRLQQNQESAMMEDFVHQQADRLGLRYICRTADQQLKSEAAARTWRHKVLAEMAAEAGCTHIVLGHTATDRAETLMFNLIRGAGPSGLSSMGWGRPMTDNSKLQLVRPLLDFTREETAEVCRITGTPVYEDSTNSDDQYSRNRLRLRVFPQLAAINPMVVQHMAQTSELLQADSHLLDSLAQRHMRAASQQYVLHASETPVSKHQQAQQRQRETASGTRGFGRADGAPQSSIHVDSAAATALSVRLLLHMPRAVRHRVIHHWLQQQAAVHSATYRMVQEVQDLLVKPAGVHRTSTLCKEHRVVRHNDLLLFVPNSTADGLFCGEVGLELAEQQQQHQHQQQQQHQQQSEVDDALKQVCRVLGVQDVGILHKVVRHGLLSMIMQHQQQQRAHSSSLEPVQQRQQRTMQLMQHQQGQQKRRQQQQQQQHILQLEQPASGAGAAVPWLTALECAVNASSSNSSSTTISEELSSTLIHSWQQTLRQQQEQLSGVVGCDSKLVFAPPGRRRRKVAGKQLVSVHCMMVDR